MQYRPQGGTGVEVSAIGLGGHHIGRQKEEKETIRKCIHYAMNLPTSTVITGIDSLEILKQGLEAVKKFRPLTEKQVADLLARTVQAASRHVLLSGVILFAAAQGSWTPVRAQSL